MSKHGLPKFQVLRLARELISALVYCHEEARISHRDLKPENIMIDNQGNVVLIDFGVSALLSNDDIVKGTVGTLRFYAPEIVRTGDKLVMGTKTDVWALGISLFYAATRKWPFDAKSIPGLQEQLKNSEPDYNSVSDPGLVKLL